MLDFEYGVVPWRETLADGACILRRRVCAIDHRLIAEIDCIAAQSPFSHFHTPNGGKMSVAMTNCGEYGWQADKRGYGYQRYHSGTKISWPAMPRLFQQLADEIAQEAGFNHFLPDACLINRYVPGARMGLHQDKDEHDMHQPILSISLGLPVIFRFGGCYRQDPVRSILLEHGDVVIWGGASRLCYHGVQALKPGNHPLVGPLRYNLTLRKAR